jgi:hypothetical protein
MIRNRNLLRRYTLVLIQQIQRFLAYEPMPALEEISMLPFSHGGGKRRTYSDLRLWWPIATASMLVGMFFRGRCSESKCRNKSPNETPSSPILGVCG